MPAPENESPDDPLRAHGITIGDSAEPVSPEQLDRIERSLNYRLPAESRSFLLRANGGVPDRSLFHYTVIDEDEGTRRRQRGKITRFYPARPTEAPGAPGNSFLTGYQNAIPFGFPDWLLPIAGVDDALEGSLLCIAVKGKKQGRIYYWPEQEIGEDTLHRVADSFNAFLALLGHKKSASSGPAPARPARRKPSLARAAATGQLDEVQRLLQRGASAYSAYAYAADAGQAAILRYLLDSGALQQVGHDALRFTRPELWKDLGVVRGLVKAGAHVNHTFFDGTTPLHEAAQHGTPEVVQHLLACGAVVGVWSHSLRQTALHRAIFDEQDAATLAKMKLLLDAGEDLHARPPVQSPAGLPEHLSQRLGSIVPGLADLLGSVLQLTTQPAVSAAELLIAQGRTQLLHELEEYLARRRPAP
jgi:ankyrin repeat protein